MSRNKHTIASIKLGMLRLGVIAEVSQNEIDELNRPERVKAYCQKCEQDHTILPSHAEKCKKNSEGIVLTKCGNCYL